MPRISRHNDLAKTGHGCSTVAPVRASQFSVFANSKAVLRPGDKLKPHKILVGLRCVGHQAKVNRGSRTVFAQGKPVARVGDSADKGAMKQGSFTVFAGG
tara:strand:- start:1401 stop:1700 length:300 start_codon:yes stop_codon:yes gene_type:complete